jgi:hypothetical protein
MYLHEAVDAIREKLVRHRLSGRKTLWSTNLKQIAKQNAFDGHYVDTILEIIRSFLSGLEAGTILSLWKQTETGMGDETEEECLFPDAVRMDLEMELLHEVTTLAWEEANDAPRR